MTHPGRTSSVPHTLPSGGTAGEAEARAQRLSSELTRARQDLSAAEVDLRNARGERDALRADLAQARARIAELEAELEKSRTAAPPGGDDLKRIKGIGPKYEKLLKSLGVTRFEQVAGWSDDDLPAVAAKLGIKPERIRREDWPGSARVLVEKN